MTKNKTKSDASRFYEAACLGRSQIMQLLNLSPGIQEEILTGEVRGLTERRCRAVAAEVVWADQ